MVTTELLDRFAALDAESQRDALACLSGALMARGVAIEPLLADAVRFAEAVAADVAALRAEVTP